MVRSRDRGGVLFTCFFFFQAEDGIRDSSVTGVQTCALPIWISARTVSEPAASRRNRGGTPLISANLFEKTATGIKPAKESTSMEMLPVLTSLLAASKFPFSVASATYFWTADLTPAVPNTIKPT